MLHAIDHGGHARIGFENNMYLPDGSLADHTADLVSSLASVLTERGNQIASAEETRRRLGIAV